MIDLRAFAIEQADYRDTGYEVDGHSELSVVSTPNPGQPVPGHTMVQLMSAADWSAGVLARVALALQPLIASQAAEHDCRYVQGDVIESVCSLGMHGVMLGEEIDESPHQLWLMVPTDKAREWTARLGALLAAAAR
jgi:hypothetical protein